MDNNQQTPSQEAATPAIVEQAGPEASIVTPSVTNLGVHEAKTMQGSSIQSPFSGSDVSMTTGQTFGGPIVSTEQGSVSNETRPAAN